VLDLLRRMFDAMVASAQPERVLPKYLPPESELGSGRLWVVGAGKASAAMARVVEQHYQRQVDGLVITRYGHAVACDRIQVVQALHPVPDEAGWRAAQAMLDIVSGLSEQDTVICLISGGGSALMPLPMQGLSLHDKQTLNQALLRSGASISEINCVRRHLSAIKGGRLAAACYPARVYAYVISDVPGDQLHDIASGPTVADPTTCAQALQILQRYNIPVGQQLAQALQNATCETVKPLDVRLTRASTQLIASPQMGLEAAAQVGKQAGLPVHILSDRIEGVAQVVGKELADLASQVWRSGQPFQTPCVLLSGGETSVALKGSSGRGGRNVETLLSFGWHLPDDAPMSALFADTDGVDGTEPIAGAIWSPGMKAQANSIGMSGLDALNRHDAHSFFERMGASLITGPTRTNINDFRAIYIP